MKHPIFLIYGLAILMFTGFAEYRGYSFSKVNELRNVPKTVRDNPGAYRSHYGGYGYGGGAGRYSGGK
jgi:hypothetical protein